MNRKNLTRIVNTVRINVMDLEDQCDVQQERIDALEAEVAELRDAVRRRPKRSPEGPEGAPMIPPGPPPWPHEHIFPAKPAKWTRPFDLYDPIQTARDQVEDLVRRWNEEAQPLPYHTRPS